MKNIVDKFISQLNDQLADKKVKLKLDKSAKEQLIEEGFDTKMGARPLQRVITNRIKLPLSKQLLFQDIKKSSVTVTYDQKTKEFTING